jgi:hypothetical protein
VNTKLSKFSLGASITLFDFLFFTETWLNSGVNDGELGFDRYCVYRKDRDAKTSVKSRGGGVMICISKKHRSSRIKCLHSSIEQVYVKIVFPRGVLIVGCIYVPPGSGLTVYSDHNEELERIRFRYPDARILIAGDYNLPRAEWSGCDSENLMGNDECFNEVKDMCSFLNLVQINVIRNGHDRLLDLIFTDIEGIQVSEAAEPILPVDDHHPPLELVLLLDYDEEPVASKNCRDFHRCDYISLIREMSSIDWSFLDVRVDVDAMVSQFYKIVNDLIEKWVPLKRPVNRRYPRWFTRELIDMVESKKRLHLQYKISKCSNDYEAFSAERKKCQVLANALKLAFYKRIECQLPGSSVSLYKLTKSLKDDHRDFPRLMYFENRSAGCVERIADLFRDFFMSTYNEVHDDGEIPVFPQRDIVHIPRVVFSESDIERGIDLLDDSKGAGPDRLPPLLIKKCKSVLSRVLMKMFNASVESGLFPTLWKTSYIIPVFKKGDKSDVSNYRPICIQSCIPKLFESILLNRIKADLAIVISLHQHGFLPGRSTLTNLLEFHSDIMDSLVRKRQLDCIYTDYSKAFDRVSHPILLAKLRSLGVDGSLLSWFRSYLEGRTQTVSLSDIFSPPFVASSGVPQGSHLGPILFNIFINDLLCEFDGVGFVVFADDLKLYREIENIRDCEVLQRNINSLVSWCSKNRLSLNMDKCQVMRFFKIKTPIFYSYIMNGTQLMSVSQIRDLGVLMDTSLSFVPHINAIVERALRTLGFTLRLCEHFSNIETFVILFTSLVRPILEYNSVLWSPHYEVHRNSLERVQKRFLRFVNFRLGIPVREIDYAWLRGELGLQTLSARRSMSNMLFLHKLINGNIDSPGLLSKICLRVPNRNTRADDTFGLITCSTNYHFNSPVQRLMREGNALLQDLDIFSLSTYLFKKLLKERVQ